MKTIIKVLFVDLMLIFSGILFPINLFGQEKECWEYKAHSKTYFTKARDNEVLDEVITKGPFKTLQECKQNAEKNRGTKTYESWILKKRDLVPGNCSRCSQSSSKTTSTKQSSFENRNQTLENDHLSVISNTNMMKWYQDIINPINYGNIAQLLGVYAKSVPIELLGTSIGSINVGIAYIKMFEQASEASLRRAMNLLNVQWDERQKFLTATGAYVMKQSILTKYSSPEDASIIRDAFLMSAALSSSEPTETSVLTTSALLAIAGLVASETGNKEMAKTFITSAMMTLSTFPDSPNRDNLANLMQSTNTGFTLGMEKLNNPEIFSKWSVQKPKTPDISGEYECIDCQSTMKGVYGGSNVPISYSTLRVTVNQDQITLHQTSKIDFPENSESEDGVIVTTSRRQWTTDWNASGQIQNGVALMKNTTESFDASYTISSSYGTQNIPSTTNTYTSNSKLTLLSNGNIQIYFEVPYSSVPSVTYNFRKIR